MKTIVCIPAYNEEKNIGSVVRASLQYADLVLVCNDGSSDRTKDKAKEAGAYVASHERNMGKGAAMRTLFSNAKKVGFDILVTMDGDGQFYPEDMLKLITPVKNRLADVVVGNRFAEADEMPSYRKFGNKMFDKLTSAAAEDLGISDTQSGFRAYSKKAIDELHFTSSGYAADSEILVSLSKKPIKIIEENVRVKYKTETKTSSQDPITHGGDVISHLLESIAIDRPLRYLGIPGVIFTIVAIYFSTVAITLFNQTGYFSIPNTLVSVGFFLVGILLLLTSAILFAINKLFEKNQPQ